MALIVGTAGHIDHGKTALVQALTGQNTDRLREEQERGISIDLGFAHFAGPGGEQAGVIDVPGHERFIRTMLAGAHGMDLVLFTVAADDGVMPQSEEHLDILHLLGIERGIFVITKVDLVDAERVAAVREEIEILAAGTTLESAPIVAVSVHTGEGLDELRRVMEDELRAAPPHEDQGRFRLPVDRAFVMRGHGVVVTGTAIAGSIAEGDLVRVFPAGDTVRVRGMQVHGRPVRRAGRHARVAMNLAGLERRDVGRGHVICEPSIRRTTTRIDAWVELRPGARLRLETHGRVRVHLGTSETLARVVLLDGRRRLDPGDQGYVQLVLRAPLVALWGDRFVLRDETARWTLGGGHVLAPFALRHGRGAAATVATLGDLRRRGPQASAALLRLSPDFAAPVDEIALALDEPAGGVRAALEASGAAVVIGTGADAAFVLQERWRRFEQCVLDEVAAAHARDSLAPGVELEHLRSKLPWAVEQRLFRRAVDVLVDAGRLVREEGIVRTPGHRVTLGAAAQELGDEVEAALAVGGLTPPGVTMLAERLGASPARLAGVLRVLEREGRIVRIAPDIYFHAESAQAGRQLVDAHCRAHGEITAGALRDLMGASRKFAIAFLDWCDRTGFTLRVGDVRRLRG